MKPLASTLALAAALSLAGCGQQGAEAPGAADSAPREPAATLPDGLFLAEAPTDAPPLSQARAAAANGGEITFTGYIGGRADPFTAGRALFLVADTEAAPACIDGCPIPWDACCTPGDVIAANSATVQVVDGEGRPLRMDLQGVNGLAPGAQVTVVGSVREADGGILLVDANGISVAP